MKFERPIGSASDVKELEYVCALHQTSDDENWMDGSIEPLDVVYFLRSRYGIYTDESEVKSVIFKGLAGGDGDDDCLDMMEMVAVLIIPLLLEVALSDSIQDKTVEDFPTERAFKEYLAIKEKRKSLKPPKRIIGDVHRNILIDSESFDDSKGVAIPPKITPSLIRKIFAIYDEVELIANDDLVNEMVALASGGDPDAVLDEKAFARALTEDVKLYDPNSESKISSRFYDVFGTDSRSNKRRKMHDNQIESGAELKQVDTRMTLGQIDFTADNIRSTVHVVLIWIVIIASYIGYVYTKGQGYEMCFDSGFWCKVGNSISFFLQLMALLAGMGTVVGTSLSFGNSVLSKSILGPILGLVANGVFVFTPVFVRFNAHYFSTEWDEDSVVDRIIKWLLFICGIGMSVIQIQNITCLTVPWATIAKSDILASLLLGSSMKASFRMKQASSLKINKMVKNAYDLHEQDSESNERRDIQKNLLVKSKTKSTQEIALLNYTKVAEETAEHGGLLWAWKQYITGNIQSEEGVWLHSRLIAGNAAQFLVCFILMAILIFFAIELEGAVVQVSNFLEGEVPSAYSDQCVPMFDSSQCYFPFEPHYAGNAICAFEEIPSDCTVPNGLLEPISSKSLVFRDVCLGANLIIEGLADSPTAMRSIKGLSEKGLLCYDFINLARDAIKDTAGISSSDGDSDTPYQDCLGCKACKENVNNTASPVGDPCRNLCSSDCPNIIETVKEKVIDFVIEKMIASAADNILDIPSRFNTTAEELLEGCLLDWGDIISFWKTFNFCFGFEAYRPTERVLASTVNGTCETPVTYCLSGYLGNETLNICTVGIDPVTLLPFQWKGEKCYDDPYIKPMMEFYDRTWGKVPRTAQDLVPEQWVIRLTAGVAILCSVFTSLATAMVYIPSTIHTVLKFRSGVIPSLRDPYFISYRKSLHLTTFMVGAMFWGLIGTTLAVAFLVAGGVFLVCYHVTAPILLTFIPAIIGISVTMGLKIFLCMFLGQATFSGLYRKRPALANVSSLALECWHILLTFLSVFIRLAKFLVVTGMYLGRIDRPIFQKDLMVDLDSYPKAFRQDILLAEAHHHPYLERLGLMYMMKLRYGSKFSTTAGATWRLLFVTALMPWLRKHRILDEKFDLQCDELQDKVKETKAFASSTNLTGNSSNIAKIEEENEAENEEEIDVPSNKNEEQKQEEEDPGFYQVKE
eukprot:CAMPEP_0194219644 /NCGR_PEP_ID=MMETSP0156-20130528/26442_1 /TAXON_ID=33649 /ORGANISM="Thalassionema nitzschioides, Strain L26-B" /LENGTH=1198 /DNA_ID=CAMNT_0038949395 /DNA_START=72 /DNA_END=3668 /DNA_ORIENTATION=-